MFPISRGHPIPAATARLRIHPVPPTFPGFLPLHHGDLTQLWAGASEHGTPTAARRPCILLGYPNSPSRPGKGAPLTPGGPGGEQGCLCSHLPSFAWTLHCNSALKSLWSHLTAPGRATPRALLSLNTASPGTFLLYLPGAHNDYWIAEKWTESANYFCL